MDEKKSIFKNKTRGLVIIVNYNQDIEVKSFLDKLSLYHPIENSIFVDDGSTDTSKIKAEKFQYQVINHPFNLGAGAAIRSGIKYGIDNQYEYVVIMSSNGKMKPEELHSIIYPIEKENYDYVSGSRFLKDGSSPGISLFRKMMIPVFSRFAGFCMGRHFSDITCGYRAYKLEHFLNGNIDIDHKWLDTYELEYYIHYRACQLNMKMKEVPVTIQYNHLEKGRSSKIMPILGWWRMIRPLLFLKLGIKK